MAQRIKNIYRLVTVPAIYRTLQAVLGSKSACTRLAEDIVRAEPGFRLLDVGCGPGSMLPYLPDVDYVGIDLNPKHIEAAKRSYADRGKFIAADVSLMAESDLGKFDVIMVFALLHHLSDQQAKTLFASLKRFSKPTTRIVTMDNVWLPRQRLIAVLLNKLDSGLNIRSPEQYQALLDGLPFTIVTTKYRDLLTVPYDHFCMTLTHRAA